MTEVHVVVPEGIDDPARPSGGNVYDRRVCRDLAATRGWRVREAAVPGSWPRPDAAARAELERVLAGSPDGAVVLLDGLVACGVPEVVIPHARRLRVAVLVHLPLVRETGLAPAVAADLDARERATLGAASAVVVTSPWAAHQLDGVAPSKVHVAPPGSDPAPLAPGTDGASRLLCVASITPAKGHDVLVDALAEVTGLPWSCACAGALHRNSEYVGQLRRTISRRGLDERVELLGPLAPDQLAWEYAEADLVVLASRAETYGMVVTEALRRGIPVLATTADALPETLGRAPDGSVPGLLVPPDDAAALAGALRRWLRESALRNRLRASARSVRGMLKGWEETSRSLDEVLERLRRSPAP